MLDADKCLGEVGHPSEPLPRSNNLPGSADATRALVNSGSKKLRADSKTANVFFSYYYNGHGIEPSK